MVWRVHVTQLAADVGIDAEDGATVNEDLCKDVEDTVVNLAGRRHQQRRECHDDAREEQGQGGPFLWFHDAEVLATFGSPSRAPPVREGEGHPVLGERWSAARVAAAAAAARVAATAGSGAAGSAAVRIGAFGVFHVSVVGRDDALHDVAVAVVAGDVDSRLGQRLPDFGVGREDDAAAGDEAGRHLVDVGHRIGAQSEPHAAQSRHGHAVALGGPCLDDLADGVPCSVDGAPADARTEGCLLDYLVGRELAVEVGLEHVGPLLFTLREGHVALDCFYFDCHGSLCFFLSHEAAIVTT